MTASDRFDLLLADALQDLAGDQYPDYFDDALDVATRRSQRPSWTFLERWIPMDTATRRTVIAPTFPWRTVGLILVIIALLIATAAALIIGSQRESPAPPFGPAANGLIVYSANDGDIFVRDPRGGPARLLVGTDDFDADPVFSRDGTQITFLRLNGNPFDPDWQMTKASIFAMKQDGSDLHEIWTSNDFWGLSWSVDGAQAAIIGGKEGSRALQVVNVSDGSSRSLPTGDVEPVEGVEWRPPVGDEVIFRGREGEKYAIYGIRPDGTAMRQISADGTEQDFWVSYAITPDGNKLLYGQQDTRVDLRILDLDTRQDKLWGGALPVIHTPGGAAFLGDWGSAVLSPDGTRIAFGRYWDVQSGTLNHQVFVASLASDGADAIPIGEPIRSQGGRNPFRYAFSPDGKDLIVWFNDTEEQGVAEETWIADPTDGSYQLLPWGTVIAPPAWQRVAAE